MPRRNKATNQHGEQHRGAIYLVSEHGAWLMHPDVSSPAMALLSVTVEQFARSLDDLEPLSDRFA